MKKILIVLSIFCFLAPTTQAKNKEQKPLAPEGSPLRAIQDLDRMLNSYHLGATTDEERKYNEELKKKVVNGTFDVAELCRLALDKHWQARTDGERKSFVDLMTRLLERKAIFSKEQSLGKKGKGDYYAEYATSRLMPPNETRAVVNSFIHIPKESLKIAIDYKLKKIDGQWKIFDVVVDDASLVNNYKYQFDKIINKDGYGDLVRRMEAKLKDLEQ